MPDNYLDAKTGDPVVLPALDVDWITYSGTLSGTGSKVFTATTLKYRQYLNGYEIVFSFSGNTVASGGGATTTTMPLPSGAVIDTNYLPNSTIASDQNDLGWGYEFGVNGLNTYSPLSAITPASTTTLQFIRSSSGLASINSGNMNNTNPMQLTGRVWVPIVGLSSMRAYGAGLATVSGPTERSGLVRPRKGQTALTVTGTGWTTVRARGIYYQDQDGNPRMKFNIVGNVTGLASGGFYQVSVVGTVFESTANNFQAVSAFNNASLASVGAYTAVGGDTINYQYATGVPTRFSFSGDVELASKPTWA